MKIICPIVVVLIVTAGNRALAWTDTFTAPLSFAVQTGTNGQYLSANYDFHTQFSEIDSVTLQFTMPDGYEGSGVAGGYFSIFSQLWMAIQNIDTVPNFGNFIGGPPPADPSLRTTTFDIQADSPQQFSLYDLGLGTDGNPRPDFLNSGTGIVAMTNYQTESFGFQGSPNPDPSAPTSTTITWLLPGDITDASITVVGTAAPEPSAFILLALAAISAWNGVPRRRRCVRSRPTAGG